MIDTRWTSERRFYGRVSSAPFVEFAIQVSFYLLALASRSAHSNSLSATRSLGFWLFGSVTTVTTPHTSPVSVLKPKLSFRSTCLVAAAPAASSTTNAPTLTGQRTQLNALKETARRMKKWVYRRSGMSWRIFHHTYTGRLHLFLMLCLSWPVWDTDSKRLLRLLDELSCSNFLVGNFIIFCTINLLEVLKTHSLFDINKFIYLRIIEDGSVRQKITKWK